MLVAPHNVGGPVLTAANLHLAACTPNFKIQEHFNDFAELGIKNSRPATRRSSTATSASRKAPASASTLDLDALARHPRQHVFFNLYAEDWHKRQATVEE